MTMTRRLSRVMTFVPRDLIGFLETSWVPGNLFGSWKPLGFLETSWVPGNLLGSWLPLGFRSKENIKVARTPWDPRPWGSEISQRASRVGRKLETQGNSSRSKTESNYWRRRSAPVFFSNNCFLFCKIYNGS